MITMDANVLLGKLLRELPNLNASPSCETDLKSIINQAIDQRNYAHAIYSLMELRDLSQGIKWKTIPGNTPENKILIRDARKTLRNSHVSYHGLAVLGLNYIRGCLSLLGEEDASVDVKQELKYLARIFINSIQISKDYNEDFQRLNKHLLNLLADKLDISISKARKRLTVAKDFVNLQEPAIHIVTLKKNINHTTGKENISFEADLAITDLTENIKNQYKNIERQTWFRQIPHTWLQQQVKYYAKHIKTGKYIIPTQLRKYLPGIRNAYEKITGILQPKPIILGKHYHSGTIAYLSKSNFDNETITELNLQQIDKLTGDHGIHMLTLNSEFNFTGNDRNIVCSTKQVTEPVSHWHSNLTFNGWRHISPNRYAGLQNLLGQVLNHAEVLQRHTGLAKRDLDEVYNYITEKPLREFSGYRNEQELFAAINTKLKRHRQYYPEYFKMLQAAIYASHLLKSNTSVTDPNNLNLSLAVFINIIHSEMRRLKSPCKTLVSACASGKDRDGLLMYTTSLYHEYHHFNSDFPVEFKQQNRSLLFENQLLNSARAGHTQFMAGFQGATLGCFGVKRETEHAIPKLSYWQQCKDILIQFTADFNKLIPAKPRSNLPYYYPTSLNVKSAADWHLLALETLKYRYKRTQMKIKPQKFLPWYLRLKYFLFTSKSLARRRAANLQRVIHDLEEKFVNGITPSLAELNKAISELSRNNASLIPWWTWHKQGGTQKQLNRLQIDLEETINSNVARY